MIAPTELKSLNERFNTLPTEEILRWAGERFGARAAIGTSFQGAGLVMMHLAKRNNLPFPVFTLDTGLLFKETLELKTRLEDFYGFKIESLEPDLTVEEQADINGPELWKRDPDLCCQMRKVEPLSRALKGRQAWVSGLRRDESDTRAQTPVVAYDEKRAMVKVNPLAAWSHDDVQRFIDEEGVFENPLKSEGYASIGCGPCTRAIAPGEDERAGRWAGRSKTECGLHT